MGFVRFILFILIASVVIGLIVKWVLLFVKKAKKIEVQRIMAEKWSGNYPNTLVMSGGEEQSLLLNLGGLASS